MLSRRYTTQTNAVIDVARESARSLGHEWVGTEHLLLALAINQEASGSHLAGTAATPEVILAKIMEIRGQGDPITGPVTFTQRLCIIMLTANKVCLRHGHDHVTPEHLLYALLTTKHGHTSRILADLGIDTAVLSRTVLEGLINQAR